MLPIGDSKVGNWQLFEQFKFWPDKSKDLIFNINLKIFNTLFNVMPYPHLIFDTEQAPLYSSLIVLRHDSCVTCSYLSGDLGQQDTYCFKKVSGDIFTIV